MLAYQSRTRRTIEDAVTEAIAAASSVRADLVEHIHVLIGLDRAAPVGSAAADDLRADIRRALDQLAGIDLALADELELEWLDVDSGPAESWGVEWDLATWETTAPAGGADLGMADPADTDEDAPSDPTCPTARELAARHACGTIAELSIGCIYVDADGTVFLQPHPTGREEDDLPDRERIGAMVWDHDEARWVAEPRHEGHDLDMPVWGVVEDVARDWARQF